jgi:hypothetical protein
MANRGQDLFVGCSKTRGEGKSPNRRTAVRKREIALLKLRIFLPPINQFSVTSASPGRRFRWREKSRRPVRESGGRLSPAFRILLLTSKLPPAFGVMIKIVRGTAVSLPPDTNVIIRRALLDPAGIGEARVSTGGNFLLVKI